MEEERHKFRFFAVADGNEVHFDATERKHLHVLRGRTG